MSFQIYNKYSEQFYEWNRPTITIRELKQLMGYPTGVWRHPQHNFQQTYSVIVQNKTVYYEQENTQIDVSLPVTVDIKLQSPYFPC